MMGSRSGLESVGDFLLHCENKNPDAQQEHLNHQRRCDVVWQVRDQLCGLCEVQGG